ncbi:hypothetical protein QFC21_002142 [Naganishia friedmannii]|uniref:Uncharacterized protein n=1 Tax=Naganishia friedmannii TaxID=89922 RepID=A0ACC2W010_9TREE|nr:hypothetical protein QFC21_002142 [Naganishia friedmannii]
MSTQPTAPGASTPVDEHHEERAHVLPPLKTFDTTNFTSSRVPASPTSPQNKSGFSKIGRARSAYRSSVTGIAANNTSQFVSLATAANGGDVARAGAHVPPTYMPASAGQDGLTRLSSTASFRRVTSRPPIVSIMGSVSPPDPDDSDDDNAAFVAVRSREEATARDERRNRARGYSNAIAPPPQAMATSGGPQVHGRSRGSSDDSTLAEPIDPATGRKLGLGVSGAGSGVGPQGELGGTAQNAKQVGDVEKGEADVTVEKTDEEWIVRFEKGDPENPKNWSSLYRWYLTAAGSLLVLNSTFASSAPSGVVPNLERQFGFGREVGTLTISLFVAGYTCGPLIWGPASEQVGRKPVFLVAFLFYTGFQGPALGPIVGGFIGASHASWRWLFWVLTLFAGFCGLLVLFTVPETYTPKILATKAKRLRKETGDARYWAPQMQNSSANRCVCECSVYLLFEAYPIVFSVGHGFSAGITGTADCELKSASSSQLMFLGVFLGGVLSTIFYLVYFNPRYKAEARRHAPAPTPPEVRIEFCLMASPLLVIAFFVFGWTSYPTLSWVGPCIGGAILGAAVLAIFVSLFNYIVDTYVSRVGMFRAVFCADKNCVKKKLFAAASALAANTVCRSCAGAAFPLFATQMYETLNPRWASTLLGCLALVMAPIPFVLMKYGPTLRARSKHAPDIGAGKK